MSSQVIKNVRDFINRAEKLGKYPRNTAVGLIAAVKVIEEGLLPDEPDDARYITEHLEEIYHRQMDKHNLSSASVETYIRRVKRAFENYQEYGSDPKALYAWKPRTVQRAPRSRKDALPESPQAVTQPGTATAPPPTTLSDTKLKTLIWSLRPDLSIQIQLPVDLDQKDVKHLTKLLQLEAELSDRNAA